MKEFQLVFYYTINKGPLERIRSRLRCYVLPYLATKLLQNYNVFEELKLLPFRLVCTPQIKFAVADGRITEHSDRAFYPRMLRVMEDFHMMNASFRYINHMLADLRLHESFKCSKIGTKAEWSALKEEYEKIKEIQRKVFDDELRDDEADRLSALTKLRNLNEKEVMYMQMAVDQLAPLQKPSSVKQDQSGFRCYKRCKLSKFRDTVSDKCRKNFDAGLNRML